MKEQEQTIRTKRGQSIKQKYILPNYLNNRNVVAKTKHIWVIDITELRTKLANNTNSSIKMFFVIDLATQKVVTYKLFKAKGNGAIKADCLVRVLDRELAKIHNNGVQQLMLHSDRGPEFVCAIYHELFNKYKFAFGSMSDAYEPNQNAVAEKFIRTFKYQLNQTEVPKLPDSVKGLQELENIVNLRIDFYNTTRIHNNYKNTPEALEEALDAHENNAPAVIAHWPIQPKEITPDQASLDIDRFRKYALLQTSNRHPIQVLLDNEKQILAGNRGIQQIKDQVLDTKLEVYETQQKLLQRINDLEHNLSRKSAKPTKRLEMPLRDPAGSPIYDYLMSIPRPKHITKRIWARNRIAITLLRFLGVRASELIAITLHDLQNAIQKGTIQLLQPKTKTRRVIVLTDAAIKQLQKLQPDMNYAFIDTDTPLGVSFTKKGTKKIQGLMYYQNWRSSINAFIKQVNDKFPGVYTSHSFRINLVTRLLKTVPIIEVKNIIGHKNINTTERYYRFQPKAHQLKATIDNAIESDRES